MRFLILLILWCLLFYVCWPLAILVLIAVPLVWLILLPFRILKMLIEATLALLRGILFLPARVLGVRRAA